MNIRLPRSFRVALLSCLAVLAGCGWDGVTDEPQKPTGAKPANDGIPRGKSGRTVLELFSGSGGGCVRGSGDDSCWPELIEMGAAAFPEFHRILNDPQTDEELLGIVLVALNEQKQLDRSSFLPVAVRLLGNPDSAVRANAAELIGQVGNSSYEAGLFPMLREREGWQRTREQMAKRAADTLALIGGPESLAELQRWLDRPPPDMDPDVKQHVADAQARLMGRLEREGRLPK